MRRTRPNRILYHTAFCLLVLALAPCAFPQAWSGILSTSRGFNWSKAGIPGGIPNYTTICATVSPSAVSGYWTANTSYALNAKIGDVNGNTETVTVAGTSANSMPTWPTTAGGTVTDGGVTWTMSTGGTDTSNIDNAIASCGAAAASTGVGQVVQLQPSTYVLDGGVIFNQVNKVVLRGAGPDKTILKFTGLVGCGNHVDICIFGGNGNLANYTPFGGGSTTWTGDNGTAGSYNQGDSIINVGGTWTGTAPAVGDIIQLDQRDDDVGICPQSGGTGPCSGVSGETESGTTVTITTSFPHHYAVGSCVGVGPNGTSSVAVTGYVSAFSANLSSSFCGFTGWFSITAVYDTATSSFNSTAGFSDPNSTQFQYTVPTSGLTPSGGGYTTEELGGVYSTVVYDVTASGLQGNGRSCPDSGNTQCATGEISMRPQTIPKRITACNGVSTPGASCNGATSITIDPPLVMTNWRSSQNPGAWWTGGVAMLDGVEGLTYDMSLDGGQSGNDGLSFYGTYQCWAKNVRGIAANRDHVAFYNGFQNEVVDSYFFGTKAGAQKSYGVEAFGGSENLFQNNICQHAVACILVGGDYGDVFGYNYTTDDGYYATNWMQPMLFENHDFSGYDLFEGNDTNAVDSDTGHGPSQMQTNFRNRITGFEQVFKNNYLVAVADGAFNRQQAFIGNVIGDPGWQLNYQSTHQVFPPNTIWNIGQLDVDSSVPDTDTANLASMFRWGNYDAATGTTRWCGNSSSPGWTADCQQITSGTYTSGGTITGTAGETCNLAFAGAAGGATAVVVLTGSNTIASGTAMTITAGGVGFTSSPSSATLSNGTATCSGTATVSTVIGGVSEVPTAVVGPTSPAPIPANPVPSSTSLPASFYLASQPAFWTTKWGTPGWPAIGPDVTASGPLDATCNGSATACDGVSNMSYQIPAQIAYNNLVAEGVAGGGIDPNYQHSYPVSSTSYASGQITFTVTSTPTVTISPATTIVVSGASPSVYNGAYQVTGPALGTPSGPHFFNAVAGSGPPAGVYTGLFTWTNSYGESLPSAAVSATSSGSNLSLQLGTYSAPAAATGFNVYITIAGGNSFYLQASVPINSTNCPSNVCQYTFTGSSINTSGANPPSVDSSGGNRVTVAATAWMPYKPYVVGSEIFDPNGNIETVTVAGTTAANHPTWPTTAGNSVTDGTVTWQMSAPSANPGGTVNYPNILLFNANTCYQQTTLLLGMSGEGSSKVTGP